MRKKNDIEADDGLIDNLMAVAKETLSQGKTSAPMFNSEDLILDEPAKLRYDSEIELKKDINELRQAIHQQGLERGVPREILNVINDVAHSISMINSVWDSEKVREDDEAEDKKIEMLQNQGNDAAALSRKTMQTLRLREQKIELRGLLYKLVYGLERMQKLVQSADSMDARRR